MDIHSKQIAAYIDFLKKSGFTVTLHGDYINKSVFMPYNYHQNPYCHYVKTVYGHWSECICNQKKVKKVAENGSFFGCCYAGVGEFIYPVKNKDKTVCFISVSGYKAEITQAKSQHFAQKYGIDQKETEILISKYLKSVIPEKSEVDSVIEPLVFMLEAYFEKLNENESDERILYHKLLRYVTENCHKKLTMKDLSEEFNYSVSTLSHLFLKNSGKSLPTFIDDLRLNEAKWYLANSKTGITEIAYFLGYSSSNYFSSVFKAKNGISPKEYRNNNKLINFKGE